MNEFFKKAFPNLLQDSEFKITSKQDIKYNCIAWAAIYDDKWYWPPDGARHLDGVYNVWPKDIPATKELESFVKLFNSFGYEVCDNSDYEENFRKVALYVDPVKKECTHAARLKSDGLWTSKLGKEHDIAHSTPEAVEGPVYGKVACIMKMQIVN